jgi:Ethanolamine utilization protein EutJ (predicted chaperonin)
MSNSKDIITGIKKLLFGEEVPAAPVAPAPVAPAEEKMEKEYTLEDGVTIVSIDKLEVGGTVTLSGAPAPDAVHTLQDGTKITTAAGIITEVKPVEVLAEEPQAAEETAYKVPAEMAAQLSRIEKLEAALAKQSEAFSKLFPLIEKMAEVEVEAPVENQKSWEEMTSLERFRATKN